MAEAANHRLDIDGLRAVAVLPVVLYHAHAPGFGGGFVGVDIFFVISGYLITRIIVSESEADRFSLLAFYERRVRRIIPALFAMLGFCGVAATALYLPPDLRSFSEGTLATLGFVSNVLFWQTVDYFSSGTQTNLLLHTWSLAIEEQFYLLYPPVFMLVWKHARRHLRALLVLSFAFSIALCVVAVEYRPTATFYLLPTRAWELLLGALLLWAPPIKSEWLGEGLAIFGLLLIAYGVTALSGSDPYPAASTLVPCGGAAMLLHANASRATLVGRILSVPPVVFIGLISYSLYLWHWPLLVLARYLSVQDLPIAETLSVLGLALLFATLSWRFVERPFRGGTSRVSRSALFQGVATLTCVFALLALAGHFSGGWPSRFPVGVVAISSYVDYPSSRELKVSWKYDTCFSPAARGRTLFRVKYDWDGCFTPASTKRNVLLWGDSHAAHYAAAFEEVTTGLGAHYMQASLSGCPPLPGFSDPRMQGCQSFDDLVLARALRTRPDVVILASHWLTWAPARKDEMFDRLQATIDRLRAHHIHVLVAGPAVEFRVKLPEFLARQMLASGAAPTRTREHVLPAAIGLDAEMKARFGHLPGVTYVSVFEKVCPDNTCPTLAAPGVPLVFDRAHLTAAGSKIVARLAFGGPLADLLGKTHPP